MLRVTRRTLKSTQIYLYSKRGSNRFQVQSIDEPLDLPRSRFSDHTRKTDFYFFFEKRHISITSKSSYYSCKVDFLPKVSAVSLFSTLK